MWRKNKLGFHVSVATLPLGLPIRRSFPQHKIPDDVGRSSTTMRDDMTV